TRRARGRRLGELVDPLLEELLISLQIRQFIGARRGKARQQRNRSSCPTNRRHASDIPLPGHRPSPLTRHPATREGRRNNSRAIIRSHLGRSSAVWCSRGVFVAALPERNTTL